MKNTTPHWIAIGILVILIVSIGFKMFVLGNTTQGDDGRIAVVLEAAEKKAVLGEMRVLLEATQTIVEALAHEDLKAVAAAAAPLGSSAIATVDFQLRAKLPLAFKKLGFGTHYAFDDIVKMANEGKPAKEIQLKYVAVMNNCIACHAMYQLKTKVKD